ncbi:MAG: 2-dehydropantoate 2-reductase [Psychromonas sp.]|jgi:2-dehydropantoate 2-reductase|uniref:ketopantoate reductase family protein n=1 Tax=Psychromonas sp. TaxID=1884585 RepID=UPI0039E579FB
MWQIIGTGAIGCLWAANLKRTGQDVQLVSRRALLSDTLHYQDLQQQRHQFKISSATRLINSTDPLLVCVKATQVKQAIQERLKMIGPQQVIILMHNGMGCAEQIQTLLPNNPIICATTANASLLHAPLTVQQTGLGITYLGPFNQLAEQYENIVEPLKLALGNTYWVKDIKQKLWLKLLINAVINPLTAIYQINNGQLLEYRFHQQIEEISREALKVARAENLSLKEDELVKIIKQVITQTALNYSSMNRDIHFKRATENEYISGYLVKKAAHHHLEIPAIKSLYEKIAALEKQSGC